jgi:hypothetical protein
MVQWQPSPALAGPLYGKEPWPLRFYTHGFGARCFNTLACTLIYNNHEFGTRTFGYDNQFHDKPSGPEPEPGWKDRWSGHHGILPLDHEGRIFPSPVEVAWTALDGSHHKATLDLDTLFKDRLILHRVAKEDIPEGWLRAKSLNPISPDILVEVNDRTINIYMRATIVVCDPSDPDDIDKRDTRRDAVLVWTHTY